MVKVTLELSSIELNKLHQILLHDKSTLGFKVKEKIRQRRRREMLQNEFGGVF